MVIVGEFVGGAALGAAFGILFDVVKEALEKSAKFKPLLQTIKSTLDSLQPVIQQIEMHNSELNLPTEEIESCLKQMEEGVELVRKLSKVSKWNYKKPRYTDQLVKLDGSLKRMIDILKVQEARDVKETLVLVRSIETVVKRIEGNGLVQSQFEINGCCPVLDHEPPPTIIVGVDAPLKELKKNFLKDGVSMLVLTGPGGCGKTTLAKAFCQDQEVKDIFKRNIFFVTVSKTSNLNHIVRELYQLKGFQVPFFHTEVTAVSWLERFLRETVQHPLLLVLDGVWSGSESFLHKFAINMSNHKILVTSRFAFPRFGSPYYLESLKDEDAMTLFRHSASLGDRSSNIPDHISRKIVERLKGFPPAIKMVGRSLCGQPIEIWKNRLMQWSKGSSILDSESDLLDYLQTNLDFLDKEEMTIKECFIDLGSFPEDQRIPVAALIDIWTELYKLDEDSMSIQILYELASQGLANLVSTRQDNWEVDQYLSEHFVTQHYMLRELAIHQTRQESIALRKRLIIDICGDNLPTWWTEQKFQPVRARLLSISTDGVFSTKWHNMQLPEGEVLVLNFQTKNYALPEFVEKMDKLKVLIVTNYGFLPAELSNFQLLGSLSNLTRIRLERVSIPSLISDSVQLKSLQKISLYMCNIGQAFSNCSFQISYAFPNLVEINIDYCHDLLDLPYNLCDLIHLKKLSITNCHKLYALPEEIGKLVNLQVLRLRSCRHLLELPNSIRSLKMLYFLDISDCCSIKELPEDIGELCSLKKLHMRQCSKLQVLPPSVLWLQSLKEVVRDEHAEKLWEPFLPYLRKMHVKVAKQNWHPYSNWNNLVVTRMEKTEVVDSMVKSQLNTVQAELQQAEFKAETKMARDDWFLTQSQANVVVTRVEKIEVMDRPVKSQIETVKTELQAEFKAEIEALRDEFTNKFDVITDLLIHLIQGKNEKEWEGKDIQERKTSVLGDSESETSKSRFCMDRNSNKVIHQLQKGNRLNPLLPEEQIARRFSAWISNPNTRRWNLEIFDAPKEWFIDLMTSGTWLTDSHVDLFLYSVRKRAHLQSQSSSQCCTITDTVFWSWMNGRWEEFQTNPKYYKWDSDLRDYPLGKSPKYARRWSEVDHLYIPINVNNQHWVALCADITRRKLTVYNSMHSAAQDGFICDILKPMATMLPSLLVQSGFYEHRPELSPLTTPFKVVHLADNIPQQIVSGDCGVFMLKYIENLSSGLPLSFAQADIQLFRKRMALEMFALTMVECSQRNGTAC